MIGISFSLPLARLVGPAVLAAVLAGCGANVHERLALSATPNGSSLEAPPRLLPESRAGMVPRFRADTVQALALTAEEPAADSSIDDVSDPFEPLNLVFHQINRGLDFVIMRPVAGVYNFAVPLPVRDMVKNGLRHVRLPGQVLNYALQGEGEQAVRTWERFFVNTFALGGLFDIASARAELAYRPTDFGITLGKWGLGEGWYFDVPLIGPTTSRASIGRVVDYALNPLTYISFLGDMDTLTWLDAVSPGVRVLEVVDQRARNADLVDEILYASPDTYVTLRSVYIQNQRDKVLGDGVAEGALPTIPN